MDERMFRRIAFGTISVMVLAGGARAQTAVERNLPPAPVVSTAPVATPNAVAASQDATPLGAELRTIVLLWGDTQLIAAANVGDGVQSVGASALDNRRLRSALARFVGRPLSRKLIAEIEAEIARSARAAHHPFVSLSTPEQEVTGGVLQIRITEFRTGEVVVKGGGPRATAAIRGRIRLKGGDRIDTARLSEDLEWVNRSPFRDAKAMFAPAATGGETDLTVALTSPRPYRAYAGWSNTGSQSTGTDRYYVGAVVALPGLTGAYASYQLTGSGDFWKQGGDWFRGQPRYLAQGARVYLPTLPRQNLELTLSTSLTNQVVNADFSVRQRTSEATLGYRSALSEAGLPAGFGDILFAIEAKRQRRQVFFGGVGVIDQSADIWQGLVGWSKGWQKVGSQLTASANVHFGPGGDCQDFRVWAGG
jgi:hemolysin activation/secretion protein